MSKIKVTSETFGPGFSSLVLAELDVRFSRATVRLAPAEDPLPFGLVLMKNSEGKYAPLTETPASGEGENAVAAKLDGEASAILLSPAAASEEAQEALALTGYAIVNATNLGWDKSVADKSAALAQLEKHGFILKAIPEE